MAKPVIIFNADTGSDTAASGAGPATAVTGTAAAHTNGLSSTTITLTNSPDLSSVFTDGSHLLWLKTPSGRQFAAITSKDNSAKTVTVEDSFNIDGGSPVNYAIGGKRATLTHADSRLLYSQDNRPGWTIETETDQAIHSQIDFSINDSFLRNTLRSSAGTRRTITATFAGNSLIAVWNDWVIKDLILTCSAPTEYGVYLTRPGVVVQNCIIDGFVFGVAFESDRPSVVVDCEIRSCTTYGVRLNRGAILKRCYIHDNAVGVASPNQYGNETKTIHGNLIVNNGGNGIQIDAWQAATLDIDANTVADNSGHGILLNTNVSDASELASRLLLTSNIFSGNAGYGVNAEGTEAETPILNANNNYFNNASGQRHGLPVGTNDLAVDPQFTGLYLPGLNLASKGFPGANGAFASHRDIGAVQRQEFVIAYPSEQDVRLGVTFGGTLTGNLALPATGNVRAGMQFGAHGTEFTGTLFVPGSAPSATTIVDLADAVAATITPLVQSAAGELARQYVPRLKLEKMGDDLFVTVVPSSFQSERADRGSYQRSPIIDVAIQKRVATVEETDEMVALADQLAHLLWQTPKLAGCTLLNVQVEPIYAAEHLEEKGVFTSVLRATYRQGRSLS